MAFRKRKFKSLIHYVCDRCSEEPEKLGAVKLNKVAWHADILAYRTLGDSVTGETYIKRQFGPTAKHMLPVLRELEKDGAIAIRDDSYYGYDKTEYIALKRADVSVFDAEEVDIINMMIRYVCDENTAASISAKTHDRIWELAEIGEHIPYFAVFAGRAEEITEDALRWARAEAERLGYLEKLRAS